MARLAAGRLDRAERLLDPDGRAAPRRRCSTSRAASTRRAFDPGRGRADAARRRQGARRGRARQQAEEARRGARAVRVARPSSACVGRSAARSATSCSPRSRSSRAWYRDLIAVAVGAERAVVHSDRLEALRRGRSRERIAGAEAACERVRETWRAFEEFNIAPQLALDALFVRLRAELGGVAAPVA